jgi:hypothetical protein
MRKLLLYILLAVGPIWSMAGQIQDVNAYKGLYDSETVAGMKAHVGELSAASLEGRKAGSEGEKAAAEYVTAKFEEYGLDMISMKDGDLFGVKSEGGDT